LRLDQRLESDREKEKEKEKKCKFPPKKKVSTRLEQLSLVYAKESSVWSKYFILFCEMSSSIFHSAVQKGDTVWLEYVGFAYDESKYTSLKAAGSDVVEFHKSTALRPLSFVVGQQQTIDGLERAVLGLGVNELHECIECKAKYAFGAHGNPHGFHGCGVAIGANCALCCTSLRVLVACNVGAMDALGASELKQYGNEMVAQSNWGGAHIVYARAAMKLEKEKDHSSDELLRAVRLNQMLVGLRLGDASPVKAIGDKVLADDARNVKALFRRGQANVKLARWTAAHEDFEAALGLLADGDQVTRAAIEKTMRSVAPHVERVKQKDRLQFGGLFERAEAAELYTDESIELRHRSDVEERMRECPFCHKRIDGIQYARHIIKFHSGEKP
jgi:FKBP-type peptidyl-prolyl cis-trans isomerase